jgi:hypothetical protein
MLTNKRNIIWYILIFLYVLVTGFFLRNKLGDDECIVFQYAKNISTGHGWTFNPGMTINGCTSVLYPLLLACFGSLGFNIPPVAFWLSLFFLVGCGVIVYLLLKQNGYFYAAYLAPFLIVVQVILLWGLGLETSLALFLSFLSLKFYFQKQYTVTTALLAIDVLARPDTMLLAGILFFHFFVKTRKIPLQQLLLFILLLLPWIVFSLITFKSFFPNTLYTKSIQGLVKYVPPYQRLVQRVIDPMPVTFIEPLFLKRLFLLFFIVLIVGGMLKIFFENKKENKHELLGLLLLWGILHIAVYIYLRIPYEYRWHMAPVAVIYCIVGAISMESLTIFLEKPPIRLLVIILLFGFIWFPEMVVYKNFLVHDFKFRNRITFYYEAAKWFKKNIPPTATIGFGEVGVLGYFSDRTIIDMAGLVTPGVSRHIYLDDPYWTVRYYRPDYLMRFSPQTIYDFIMPEDWWNKAYRPIKTISFSDTTLTLVLYKKVDDSMIPKPNDYRMALTESIEKNRINIVKELLEMGADPNVAYPDGTIPLIHATRKNSLGMVQLLLNKGAQVNKVNEVGSTALIDAANNGYQKIVAALLAKGADINMKTNSGWTALLGAVSKGNFEIVKLLLDNGADPNAVNNDGNSPLSAAAYNGYVEIVKLLLAHGADVNQQNKGGGTPLDGAMWKDHFDVVQILKQAGAKNNLMH